MTKKEGSAQEHFLVLKSELQSFELDHLSVNAPEAVLVKIAMHPLTAASTLSRLAASVSADVRCAVGENANTPVEVMRCLARDRSPDVRYSLAENHNLSVELLRILVADENPYVAARAQRTLERIISSPAVPFSSGPVSSQHIPVFTVCA